MNPGGHAAWGALVKVGEQQVYAEGGYVGGGKGQSNNTAEYQGFVSVLTEALKYPGKILIRGDSRLVICHLSAEAARDLGYGGKWKVNGGFYMPYHLKAKELYEANKSRVDLMWISRDDNSVCDWLSKKVLKDRGVTFRIQPE